MTLQTRMPKKLAVYQGSFGLGTFATSDIPKESLLGEYIGEYFTMPLTQRARDRADEAQKMVFQHRGLNYLFGLNGDQDSVLDAATVGDPTRCLNHPPKGTKPNAAAEEINVDGDVKIYFTTGKKLVKKGRELLLDYGEDYWGPSNNDKNVSGDESQ
ncbi:hypothetical protein BD311DRAFT_332208 [Dichomitus squalens]|uniref:SET domain-containing protein n=1 Tax=Dichomitus squalens TaxID=114155 RepID=A0A4Q9MQ78_9APHY|nr:hypothetical protein BD311DRAFT_332208 [Dichomitus squalens]